MFGEGWGGMLEIIIKAANNNMKSNRSEAIFSEFITLSFKNVLKKLGASELLLFYSFIF